MPDFSHIDRKNRYSVPDRVMKDSPQPPNKCNFKFQMIKFLKEQIKPDLKIIVRGIATSEDAMKATKSGANAIWVAERNHLRSAASPISILNDIQQKIFRLDPRIEVFMQGGVRRGTDVLKAMALGARGVFLDVDTLLWGLVRDGNSQGLEDLLMMVNEELALAMVHTHSEHWSAVQAFRIFEWI